MPDILKGAGGVACRKEVHRSRNMWMTGLEAAAMMHMVRFIKFSSHCARVAPTWPARASITMKKELFKPNHLKLTFNFVTLLCVKCAAKSYDLAN
jgi:hypothetical protein